MHEGFISLPYYPPSSLTYGILVNAQGQRFINEDCYHGRVGAYCHAQRDENIYLIANAEDFNGYDPKTNYLQTDYAGVSEDSIGELESELGLPQGSLESTIALYNRHAAEGRDPLFGKVSEWLKPLKLPLAALDCTPGRAFYPFFTLGGLDTLPSGEVLTPDRRPIPGLYAAGRTSCGIPRRGDGYASGSSVGDATFFGRLAGRSAAAHV
jgi:succinate dehydrogenase/fumarate reductase flavoprotein subunit